jgi:DNA-binding MarR family transcriptional regulator
MPKQNFKAEGFRLDDCVGYLVKHTYRAMHEHVEAAFASRGVTFQQWVVLMRLRDGLASTVSELCRDAAHDSGAMTRLIDQLEQRGLIERQRIAQDRRVINLRLTAAGRKLAESLIPVTVDTLNFALDGFSRAEVKQLQDLLQRILTRLRKFDVETSEALLESKL